jgi:hypothetical protein
MARESTKGVLSKKNPYYIPKYRYYELKYRCLQYNDWAVQYYDLGLCLNAMNISNDKVDDPNVYDPVSDAVLKRSLLGVKMKAIDNALKAIELNLREPIKNAVTTGAGWQVIQARYSLICTREEYYNAYHKFFWVLDKSV